MEQILLVLKQIETVPKGKPIILFYQDSVSNVACGLATLTEQGFCLKALPQDVSFVETVHLNPDWFDFLGYIDCPVIKTSKPLLH
jgi:hypothetical protein